MPDSGHPALCTVRLAWAAIVLAVFSLYCGQASAVITAEEMRAVLQSAFPGAHVQVDHDGQSGAVVVGQTEARWIFDDFRRDGIQLPSSLAAGVEVQIVRFYRFVPPYEKSDRRKRPLPLPTLLICRNSTGEWKWTKFEEHASTLEIRQPEFRDFIGIGRTQIRIYAEVEYPDVAGRAIVAWRRLLYDVDTLELLFAGSEFASATAETQAHYYHNTFEFDRSVEKERSIIVGEPPISSANPQRSVPAKQPFSIKWEGNSYAYVDDMPWLGTFEDAKVLGFAPYEKTVSIKLPDGAPAFGAEYTIDRALNNQSDMERTLGIVGVDGLIKFTPGNTTVLHIRFKSCYDVNRVFKAENNAVFEVIQMEQEHPAIKACTRVFAKLFETYEEISDLGFMACGPAEENRDAEFSVASQDADFIFLIKKEKAERLSPLGVPIPHIEFTLQLAGQNGWEVQLAPSLRFEEEEGAGLRVAPEGGYTQLVSIENPKRANAFVRNVKDGRFGKLIHVKCVIVEVNEASMLQVSVRSVIQSEPQNTRSLRVVEKN